MCGRTACALCKEDVQKACSYVSEKTGKYELPKWGRNPKNTQVYTPSYNIAPTDVTPVIVSGTHFRDDSRRMLQPMMWGMVPHWHKGDYKKHGLSTNNCRFEGLLGSKLYSRPLERGNRCVVVCDGFYEWQSKGRGDKQPYFIHTAQDDGVHVEDPCSWTNDWDEDSGWKGPKLLHMAGLYDIWTSPEGEEIYSYSVITMDSDETLLWLHGRMPAIIEGQEIADWLDIERVSAKEAFGMLYPLKKPPRSLKWHPVAASMNNSRYKDPSCNKPVSLTNAKKTSGSSSYNLLSWLKGGSLKRDLDVVKTETLEIKVDPGKATIKKVKVEQQSPTKSDSSS